MKQTFRNKVVASSLLEVMVAMVLFAVIFTLGITIYVRIVQHGFTSEKMKAFLVMNKLSSEVKMQQRWINEDIYEGDFLVQKKVQSYKNQEELLVIEFKVYNQEGTLLVQQKELYASNQ